MTPPNKTSFGLAAVTVLLCVAWAVLLWHIASCSQGLRKPTDTVARCYYIGQVDEVQYDEAGAVVRSGPMTIRLLGVKAVPLGAQAFWRLDYGTMRFSWDGDTRILHPWCANDP